MGTNSRRTRSGQNSGIGKRSVGGRASGSTPSNPSASASSSLVSPVSTSFRPGSVHRKRTSSAASVSRRGSTTSRKARRLSSSSPRRSYPQPLQEEEILAEIVVKTVQSEEPVEMDANPFEILTNEGQSFESQLDIAGSCHQPPPIDVSPPVENTSPEPSPTESGPAITEVADADADAPELESKSRTPEILTPADDAPAGSILTKVIPAEANTVDSGPAQPEIVDLGPTVPKSVESKPAEPGRVELAAPDDQIMGEEPMNIGSPSPEPTEKPVSDPLPTKQETLDLEAAVPEPQSSGPAPRETTEASQTGSLSPMPDHVPMDLDADGSESYSTETAKPTDSALVDHSPKTQAPSCPFLPDTVPRDALPPDSNLTSPRPIESDTTNPKSELDIEPRSTESALPEKLHAFSAPSDSDLTSLTTIDGIALETAANGPSETTDGHVDQVSESGFSEANCTDPIPSEAAPCDPSPAKSAISHLIGGSRNSFASSASALTERSGLSSKPPSVSSKATTPLDTGSPREAPRHFVPVSTVQPRSAPRIQFDVRPKVSVPTDLTPQEYAIECIEAAENSRLNPYALHQDEYLMLRSHISHAQVTTYLNIRNGILRLWVMNPEIAVTREEAIGCAKDARWFDVANVCFDWLVRRGFINFGCVEVRQQRTDGFHKDSQPRKRRTVAILGAGFAGLGCARQLEGLFLQYSKRFRDMGEDPPQVVVLEGRNRVGGRVYSRAFQTLPDTAPGMFRGKRFAAEMGGMIITGFDRGNPLNILVRGQLGLPYHCLRSDMSLYDTNGTAVDQVRDEMVEHLFNACLDRVSEYKFKTTPSKLIEGNHDLIDEGRDSTAEGHKSIALVEETTAAQPHALPVSEQNVAPQVNLVPVSTDRMTGKVHVEPGTPGSTRAAFKAKSLGWSLKAGVPDTRDVDLDAAASDSCATLGSVVDEALMQHKDILDLNAQDFRLLNWHIANLEYSNATNLSRLSIKGWDIDAGNEWEGKHTMVVGGYQSVARGLSALPAPLDIRLKTPVKCITYSPEGSTGPAKVELEDGCSIEADYVVNTIPLGVLKHDSIQFQPPLPSWKTDAIRRLGFGVLNKVILVYKEAFWDKDRDIFGMLQTPTNRLSTNQKDYTSRRGRFFQWFNVTNTTGMPCLLALMAGDAGYDTEVTPNDELVAEATEVLRMRYGARVTQPVEAIVTRWESDRFARGSYSNAGVNMQAEDYQVMARSIGNLHFAGEHTIVTHPATVHGAYLSGLRAASEVLDSILGPIEIPIPLVLPRETSTSLKRKAREENKDATQARLEAYDMEITEHIHSKIGYYPIKPAKVAGNPYLLFNKANYEEGRKRCEEGRRAGKGKPSPNEIRTMTSKMWKEAPPEVRKPFEDQAEDQKRAYAQTLKNWTDAAAEWEREAIVLREKYVKEHPSLPTPEELSAAGGSGGGRRTKRVKSYAEDEDSDVDM